MGWAIGGLASRTGAVTAQVRAPLILGFHLENAPSPMRNLKEVDAVELHPRNRHPCGVVTGNRDLGITARQSAFDIIQLIVVIKHPRTGSAFAGVGYSVHRH